MYPTINGVSRVKGLNIDDQADCPGIGSNSRQEDASEGIAHSHTNGTYNGL
jgi:hypothetical protein